MRMSRTRTITLGLLAAFALSAVTASAASAVTPKWWLAGNLLTGSAALAEETNVTSALKIKTTTFTFECKKVKIKKGFIESPSSRSEEAEIFEECSVVSRPECSIGATSTKPLKAVLERVGEAIKLKFEPQTGTEVATIKVTGATCALAGSYTLTGTMVCEYPGVESETIEHPLEFTPTSGSSVKVGALAAEFTGTDKVSLVSGKTWSAR
jgi:hypothetical protein